MPLGFSCSDVILGTILAQQCKPLDFIDAKQWATTMGIGSCGQTDMASQECEEHLERFLVLMALMADAVGAFETSVNTCETTRPISQKVVIFKN